MNAATRARRTVAGSAGQNLRRDLLPPVLVFRDEHRLLVTPSAKRRVARAIATPNILVGHGNRSVRRLAVSPPGTGCGGSAAACWGAQESANQRHGGGCLGGCGPLPK